MVYKRSIYYSTLTDKEINDIGRLFDTIAAMKPWAEFKREFSVSKNSYFYWMQSNNAIPKAWKENFYKGGENFHDLTFSRHHIKNYQISSLSKCNSEELYSLQVSLNDSKTTSQIYFEKLQNKEIEWKCIYPIPCRVTIDTNLHIFQYKMLNNVLCLNKKVFKFKIVSSPLCSFCNLEDETSMYLFYSCNQTKSLWSKFQELLNSKILLPQNMPQSAFFGFPDNKENFEIINHLRHIFNFYLFKSRD